MQFLRGWLLAALVWLALPRASMGQAPQCMFQPDANGHVTIPSSMTSIADNAFSSCTSLASVSIPSSVTYIGQQAFFGCSSLASVTIPSSVTSIGQRAFFGCFSLASVTIPSSVTSIGEQAFSSCTSLASVSIPSSVTSIGDYAFAGCTSLASVIFRANTVLGVGLGTFTGDPLKQVSIPIDSTYIAGGSFFGSFTGFMCSNNRCTCARGFGGIVNDSMLTCSACSQGHYQVLTSTTACTACAPGKFMPVYISGSSSPNDCQPCVAGSFSFAPGGYLCSPCSPGSFASSQGSSTCTLCPTGSAVGSFGATQCDPCPQGEVAVSKGSLSCVAPDAASICGVGQFSASGSPPCSSCVPGKFASSSGQTSCEACPAGSYATGGGQALCQACSKQTFASRGMLCLSCPGGFQPNPNQTACAACSPGTFSQNTSLVDAGYLACSSCPAGSYSGRSGLSACIACPSGLYSSGGASVCRQCGSGMSASSDQSSCFSLASAGAGSSVVAGIFANQGTPLYIIAIVTALCGGFGIFISYSKQAFAGKIYLPTLLRVVVDFALFAVQCGSEMVLASGAVSSTSPALNVFGTLIIVSRGALGAAPTLWLFRDLGLGKHSTFAPLMQTDYIFQSSKVHGLLATMSLFEARLLVHFPWLEGSFITQSQGYPTQGLLRLCFCFSLIQLAVTFVGQIGILLNTSNGAKDGAFFAVLVLNIVFSAIKLLLSVLEIVLKANALALHAGRHGRSNSILVKSRVSKVLVNPLVQTTTEGGRLTLTPSITPPAPRSSDALEMTAVVAPSPAPVDLIPKTLV